MGRKKAHTPEEIVAKLRQVEVLAAQGKAVAEAVRAIGGTGQRYGRAGAGARGRTLARVGRGRRWAVGAAAGGGGGGGGGASPPPPGTGTAGGGGAPGG